jgi:hypothetical protein
MSNDYYDNRTDMQGCRITFWVLVAILAMCLLLMLACTKAEPLQAQGKVIDVDGNVYNTLVINDQTWMLEDLKTLHYNNGDPICKCPAGKYDFYMVETEKLCPMNWHIPKSWEWYKLASYFEQSGTAPYIGDIGYWWSSSTLVEGYESPQAWSWYQNEPYLIPQEFVSLKEQYLSVRCIKDN